MSVKPEHPLAELDDVPVVRVAYQSYEEPPARQPMIGWGGLFTAVKALAVLSLLLAYPTLVAANHKLDDSPVLLDTAERHWSAPEAGVASALITRELDGPGWAADRHRWHPQARLTALPAWQDSLIEALADYGRLSLSQFSGQRDPDLEAAVRLLGRTIGEETAPRLLAAREALTRYDGRVGAGLAGRPDGPDALSAELTLAIGWSEASAAELGALASPGDGWIASREAVTGVYRAKAKAHVAHEMLAARHDMATNLFSSAEAELAFLRALEKWRIAAKVRPLFVSNQAADAVIGANHPAMMAFLLSDAANASNQAIALLSAPPEPLPEGAEAVAEAPAL